MASRRRRENSSDDESDPEPSDDWQCAVCMNAFTSPKLLPCSHTFCQQCLQSFVNSKPEHRIRFPCPVCRDVIPVPAGGVAGFKNNMYLSARATAPDKKARGSGNTTVVLCENHPKGDKRQATHYCQQCQLCMCLMCKNMFHPDHRTDGVAPAARSVKVELTQAKGKLELDIKGFKKHLEKSRKEHKDLTDKREAVKKSIEDRYYQLITMAERFRRKALLSLDTVTATIESQLPKDKLEKTVADLERLHQRVSEVKDLSEAASFLQKASRIFPQLEDRADSDRTLLMTCTAEQGKILTPTLRFSLTHDLIGKACQDFVGTVEAKEWPATAPVVEVKEQFRSVKGTQQDIFFLMVNSNDVHISYEANPANTYEQRPDLLTSDGQVKEWRNSPPAKGKASFTVLEGGGVGVICQAAGSFQSYAKTRPGLILQNLLNGTATLVNRSLRDVEIVQKGLAGLHIHLNVLGSGLQDVQCGPHRAFDIHRTSLTAVVEEPVHPSPYRTVVLFLNGERATYGSPVLPYQPSDVCFHKLGGRDVLLVADELNDAIHVVDVQTGKFLRYLAPGHPLFIQPTALNVDTRGRLWVACRGGAVLVCQPILG